MEAPGISSARCRFVFLLHAHLPDCRRPGREHSLEETWFFQALTETYIPLARLLDRLRDDGIPAPLTISLSPTLLDQLRDRYLLARYGRWLEGVTRLARQDAKSLEPLGTVAERQAAFLEEIATLWLDRYRQDLIIPLRQHAEEGRIELTTTCATHAFLPAHQGSPETVRRQIGIGIRTFQSVFDRRPAFFWLPECGYYPGLEEILAAEGIRAFGLEQHGVTQADGSTGTSLRGAGGLLRCPNGVFAFGRDGGASRLVWSARDGYPGHPEYREFHRDRGYDYVSGAPGQPSGNTFPGLPSGLKYWRVTGNGDRKEFYHEGAAREQADRHARDFVDRLANTAGDAGSPPLRFLPFDAELFGHWWFEGPRWLESVLRIIDSRSGRGLTAATASGAIERSGAVPEGSPAPSSWGEHGDYSKWVNRQTEWLYPVIHDAERRLKIIRDRVPRAGENRTTDRALCQASRTLLLIQASDWPFMLSGDATPDLARDHLIGLHQRFHELCEQIEGDRIDPAFLEKCERLDRIFPDDLVRRAFLD